MTDGVQDQVDRILRAGRGSEGSASVDEKSAKVRAMEILQGSRSRHAAQSEEPEPEPTPDPEPVASTEPPGLHERRSELLSIFQTNPGPWQTDDRGRLNAGSAEDVEAIARHFGTTMDELRTINGRAGTYESGRQWPYEGRWFSGWIYVVPSADPDKEGLADWSISADHRQPIVPRRSDYDASEE